MLKTIRQRVHRLSLARGPKRSFKRNKKLRKITQLKNLNKWVFMIGFTLNLKIKSERMCLTTIRKWKGRFLMLKLICKREQLQTLRVLLNQGLTLSLRR